MKAKQELMTLREATDELGIPYITGYKRLLARGLGGKYGRDWLLTDDDIKILGEDKSAGNPNWIAKGKAKEEIDTWLSQDVGSSG